MATINGMASPNGLDSVAWFEWSTNTSARSTTTIPYSHSTPAQSVGNGVGVVRVSATLTNLHAGFAHRFRLVVSNSSGVTYGFEQHFVTGGTIRQIAGTTTSLGLANFVAIAASTTHKMALQTNGSLVVWGNANSYLNAPQDLTNAMFISAGQGYGLAIRDNGTVRGWGANGWGANNPPSTLSNVIGVACGLFYGISLHADGSLSVWNGAYPEFGYLPPGATNLVAITSGLFHIAALRDDGEIFVWGNNTSGQLNKPAGLSNVVAVTAGDYNTVAVLSNGTVMAWGSDNSGGSFGQIFVPTDLSETIAAGICANQGVALSRKGDPTGWGYHAGPLGTVRRTVALAVGGTDILLLQSDVNPPIMRQPQSTNATFGDFVSLSVYVWAPFPLSPVYRWEKDGIPLAQTGDALNLLATRASEGIYRVVVSTEWGQTTSDPAFVRVRVPQQIRTVNFAPGSQELTLDVADAVGDGLAAANNLELRFTTNLLATNTAWHPATNAVATLTNGVLRITAPPSSDAMRYFRVVEK